MPLTNRQAIDHLLTLPRSAEIKYDFEHPRTVGSFLDNHHAPSDMDAPDDDLMTVWDDENGGEYAILSIDHVRSEGVVLMRTKRQPSQVSPHPPPDVPFDEFAVDEYIYPTGVTRY